MCSRASGSITGSQFSAAARHPVDQQQHRALAGFDVADRAAVDLDRLGLDLGRLSGVSLAPRRDATLVGGRSDSVANRCRSNTVAPVNDAPQDNRPPRGALIVVAVGLLACRGRRRCSRTDKRERRGRQPGMGPVERRSRTPRPVPVPGGKGEMQLTEAGIRATGTNVSGYSLFRVAPS